MFQLKTGLLAAAFVSMGLIGFTPSVTMAETAKGTQVAQAQSTQIAQARMTRAQRNAAEVQRTKELNEAQLRR